MSTYLEERIEWYDHNYRMGTPLITDEQFDKLEANLFKVNPEANYFSKKLIIFSNASFLFVPLEIIFAIIGS